MIRENLKAEKNDLPGPGQYYSYEKFSTLNVKKKDVRHQFFSSTEDRFKNSVFAVDEAGLHHTPAKVGPGAYESKGMFDSVEKRHILQSESPGLARDIKRVFDIPRDVKN